MSTLILFAARDSWLSWVIGAVILFIYVMNHLLALNKSKTPPVRKPVPKPPERTQGRPPKPQPQRPELTAEQAKINAEIEEFKRRAKERRGQGSREQATASGSGKQGGKQSSSDRGTQQRQTSPPTDIPVLEQRDFSTVSESVEKHLSNRGFGERAKHLADDIVRADEQMEQHMQATFARRVGTLQDSGDQGGKAAVSPATDAAPNAIGDDSLAASALAAMLRSPQSIRQAVVMQEILQRPEHRW